MTRILFAPTALPRGDQRCTGHRTGVPRGRSQCYTCLAMGPAKTSQPPKRGTGGPSWPPRSADPCGLRPPGGQAIPHTAGFSLHSASRRSGRGFVQLGVSGIRIFAAPSRLYLRWDHHRADVRRLYPDSGYTP